MWNGYNKGQETVTKKRTTDSRDCLWYLILFKCFHLYKEVGKILQLYHKQKRSLMPMQQFSDYKLGRREKAHSLADWQMN